MGSVLRRRGCSAFNRRRTLVVLTASCALVALGAGEAANSQEAEPTVEPVRFTSGDAAIAGDIHLPGGAPTAGIVLVHGSGPEPRMTNLASLLARDGFAVLTYDKRGVGESGGAYEGDNNISWDNLHLLAADAAAAVDALAAHPRVQRRSVGLMGFSQAGWVVPIAAADSRRVAFVALWSGPMCSVSDELLFGIATPENMAVENAAHAREGSPAQDVEAIRSYAAQIRAAGLDVDPRDSLRTLDIPGLWLFGGEDNEIPTEISVRQLDELIRAGKSNFQQQTLPDAGHAMRGAFQEAYAITIEWIRSHSGA